MAQTNEGKCSYCNEIISKRAMKGHLEKCKAINAKAALSVLDNFIE